MGNPFMDFLWWQSTDLSVSASYQILNDCWLYAGLNISNNEGEENSLDRYTMPYYKGKKTTISFGANIGF
jgi:hypothetical protein